MKKGLLFFTCLLGLIVIIAAQTLLAGEETQGILLKLAWSTTILKSIGPSHTTMTGASKPRDMNTNKVSKISFVSFQIPVSRKEDFLAQWSSHQMAGDISNIQQKVSVANAPTALEQSDTTG